MSDFGGSYQPSLTTEQENDLQKIVSKILLPGKGILATDETIEIIGKKFADLNVENSEENRRLYRQLLFTTPHFSDHISGVILLDETTHFKTDSGERFVDHLHKQGIVPGVKVDINITPLPGTFGEGTTEGLDNLNQRCSGVKKSGCQFAKLRAAFTIGPHTPSHLALIENSRVLARYASICQQNGLVPIVEPDVLRDGNHDLAKCQKVTEQVLSYTYKALSDYHVFLEGTILKTNMVIPGAKCLKNYTPEEIGHATTVALRRSVPPAVPGIVLLSGGLSELDSTTYLNAVSRTKLAKPWTVSFAFGRAMQGTVLKEWHGNSENVKKAQKILLQRSVANGQAQLGEYDREENVRKSVESLWIN